MFAWCSICVISTASPGPHVRAAPGVGDEVDRLGHVLREDRRRRLPAPVNARDCAARAVIGRVGLLRERVHAAVHVRVVLAQVVGQRVDHDRRLLRGRARVEVDERPPVEAPREDREVGPDVERALSDWWHTPRCPRAPPPAWRRSSRARALPAARRRARARSGSKKPSTITRTAAGRSRPRLCM